MHKKGQFLHFLLKIAEKEGETDLEELVEVLDLLAFNGLGTPSTQNHTACQLDAGGAPGNCHQRSGMRQK